MKLIIRKEVESTKLREKQRYGRNKNTHINHTYINSGTYRKKFDKISSDKELNRKVYRIAKKILHHRSGTMFEDMYWIDIDTGKVIALETNQIKERKMEFFYKNTVAKYRKMGYNEYDSQIHALLQFQKKGDISFKEVQP